MLFAQSIFNVLRVCILWMPFRFGPATTTPATPRKNHFAEEAKHHRSHSNGYNNVRAEVHIAPSTRCVVGGASCLTLLLFSFVAEVKTVPVITKVCSNNSLAKINSLIGERSRTMASASSSVIDARTCKVPKHIDRVTDYTKNRDENGWQFQFCQKMKTKKKRNAKNLPRFLTFYSLCNHMERTAVAVVIYQLICVPSDAFVRRQAEHSLFVVWNMILFRQKWEWKSETKRVCNSVVGFIWRYRINLNFSLEKHRASEWDVCRQWWRKYVVPTAENKKSSNSYIFVLAHSILIFVVFVTSGFAVVIGVDIPPSPWDGNATRLAHNFLAFRERFDFTSAGRWNMLESR